MLENKNIQSIERAFQIIDLFSIEVKELNINEISDKSGLKLSTARGIANTLVNLGVLNFDSKRKVYRLGLYFESKFKLRDNIYENWIAIVEPYAKNIANKYDVTVSFQIIENLQVYSLYSVTGENVHYSIYAAKRNFLPLTVSASGKLALAYNATEKDRRFILDKLKATTEYSIVDEEKFREELIEIKIKKYSLENQEFQLGVSSIAFPILDNLSLKATFSITTFSEKMDEIKEELIKECSKIAIEISEEIKNNY